MTSVAPVLAFRWVRVGERYRYGQRAGTGLDDRRGEACTVLVIARGRGPRNCLVEFADGLRVVVSFWALVRPRGPRPRAGSDRHPPGRPGEYAPNMDKPFVQLADGVVISFMTVPATASAGREIQEAVRHHMNVRNGADLLDVRVAGNISSEGTPTALLVEIRTRMKADPVPS